MAKLRVLQNNNLIQELDLQTEQQYIFGRSSSCDVVLNSSKEISRQHFKVYFYDNIWKLSKLTAHGELNSSRGPLTEMDLTEDFQFSIPDYQFEFIFSQPSTVQQEQEQGQTGSFSDRTQIGILQTIAFLVTKTPDGVRSSVFQLEGDSWIAGRETSCAIFIDDAKFSRQHFELAFESGTYKIRDLGSSNGTSLNGLLLQPMQWASLVSGDVISVVDWSLQFELRDAQFQEKLNEVPAEFRSPMIYESVAPALQPVQSQRPLMNYNQLPPLQPPPLPPTGVVSERTPKSKNWVRYAIVATVVVGGLFYLLDNPQPNSTPVAEKPKNQSPLDKLKPEQQQYIKDTYRLADRLYKEGRYELARQEVAKIHQLVPFYEESKNLERLSDIAIQTIIDQRKLEAREKELEEMEAQISSTVAKCQKLVNASVDSEKIENCLSPIIVLNPDHPAIIKLRADVDQVIAARIARQEQQAAYRSLVQRQNSLFTKAEKLDQSGKPLDALKAYDQVLKSKLPDPENLKTKAKRQMASLQQKLADEQSKLEKEADSDIQAGRLRDAIKKLKSSLTINPENEVTKGRISAAMGELKKQMQTLYQEGILEESVGEVETAKAKWKKIIETSLPEEDYYKKAKAKLKKYGID